MVMVGMWDTCYMSLYVRVRGKRSLKSSIKSEIEKSNKKRKSCKSANKAAFAKKAAFERLSDLLFFHF